MSNTFYIIYSNFRWPVLISGVSCQIPFILYTVTSIIWPDLRCFVSNTFYIIYSNFRYLTWSQVFCVKYLLILYTVTPDTCPDLRCFRVNTFYITYGNFRYLSWSQCFVSNTFYIIYSNFRYLTWSQVFSVKYILYYIQKLQIPVLIAGCFVSNTFYIIYSKLQDTCPDLRCFVSDYIHTVITSDTCPDRRCFVSNTFYIIYGNFRYLSWSQVFCVKYLLYYIQLLQIPVLSQVFRCQIPFILYTVTSDTSPDHRCFVSNTFYIIYSNFRYLSWSQVFRVKYLLYYIQ